MSEPNHQYEMAQAVKRMRENMPAILEFADLRATEIRAKYVALVKAGFTEQQALDLCSRQ